MNVISSLISDLQTSWCSLHDLDRAQAVKIIHQLGVSLRELAPLLNCSPSLLSHLLQAGQAPIEDRVLARLGALSTRALVRDARTVGTRRTAFGYEEITYELERTARQESQAILRWLEHENVAGADRVEVIDQAHACVAMAERASQLQQISSAPVLSMDDVIRLCWPIEPEPGKVRFFPDRAHRLAAWTVIGISDTQVCQRAFELAREKLASGRATTSGMEGSMRVLAPQSMQPAA
jgi:hypothetical protein